jgi:NHL repeat
VSITNPTNQVSLGRRAAVKTFTRNKNNSVKESNSRQARTQRVTTNQSCVAYFKQPLVLAFTLALCTLFALLALSAAVARAEAPPLVANGQFTTESGLGVAVEQSSGDVFTTGFISEPEPHSIVVGLDQKFDASGNLLPPSPFGEPFNYGAVVNPTNGDLYVASLYGGIKVYDPNTGALLSSFPVPPWWSASEASRYGVQFTHVAQIAVDSAGNVYVPSFTENKVLEYSSTPTVVGGLAVPLKTFTGGSGVHELSRPMGVAVAPSGNIWVADTGHNRIEELDPTGVFLAEIKSEGVSGGLALDGHGDVLAIVLNSAVPCGSHQSPCGHLVEYSSSGAQLADVGAGDFGTSGAGDGGLEFQGLNLVAVNQASGRVYVSDALRNFVWIFQPPVPAVLSQETAVEVGTVEANLGALVNPGGAQTNYRFEYDTREYREGEGPHGASVPSPEGSVGVGFSSRQVWASAGGLDPGTTYHYRAVITNGLGTVVGPDQTFTTQTAAQAACPNENSRGGFSAALPDCRAYEAVVPPNKASAQPLTSQGRRFNGEFYQAANDGNRFTWTSAEVLPGALSPQGQFLATRGASGWSAESAVPSLQYYNGDRCTWGGAGVVAWSPDLSKGVIKDNGESFHAGSRCVEGELFEVVPGETPRVQNLLLRDNTNSTYRLIDAPPPGVEATAAGLEAYSADLSLVIFNNGGALTPEAPNGGSFEWNKGVVRLLKFALPSGAPVAGSIVSISADGSEVFFTAGGNLYVRVNRERTVQVDEARRGAGPGGGGSFAALTADGSQVFFTDDASAGLTKDTVPGSGPNLYRYDVGTGRLSDLTPVADAQAALQGISQDGSYVYFTAKAVMSGSQANQFGEKAESSQSNLYVDHGGTITFVKHGGGVGLSPNGAYLAFEGAGSKIELYSAAANRFECASCNPFGVATAVENRSAVSNNGQVFFQTSAALLPRDTNGTTDIYEYSYATGLHLITTGTSRSESRLLGTSESGNDVFFLGRQALLVGESNEESLAIYDARVDGGFPVTPVPVCTTADACRSAPAPQPSTFGEPASQTFSGIGNITPGAGTKAKPRSKPVKCKRRLVKKKGKCVKKSRTKAKKSVHANKRASR